MKWWLVILDRWAWCLRTFMPILNDWGSTVECWHRVWYWNSGSNYFQGIPSCAVHGLWPPTLILLLACLRVREWTMVEVICLCLSLLLMPFWLWCAILLSILIFYYYLDCCGFFLCTAYISWVVSGVSRWMRVMSGWRVQCLGLPLSSHEDNQNNFPVFLL